MSVAFFASDDGCPVCSDDQRDADQLCVVEQATDVLPLERSGALRVITTAWVASLSPLG